MLITESAAITARARGISNVPGIWASEQIRRWKEITAGVHANGSWIWLQLYATGRASRVETLTVGEFDLVSSSAVPVDSNSPVPRALPEAEIEEYIEDFVQAARNAMLAGFDGVEIHAAHGFLIDQFLQGSCNQRTDQWGGSIENRARFGLTICKRVSAAIGSDRVGVKLSPWNTSHGMGSMDDPASQFAYFISELRKLGIAYFHLVRPPAGGTILPRNAEEMLLRVWGKSAPVLLAGGHNATSIRRMESSNVLLVFGRLFISNPDLPFRLRHVIPLREYDPSTFYTPFCAKGYIDYPVSDEYLQHLSAKKTRALL
jgi:NADPH2 dehydrogenase/chanoclavine-I aldehyde reductase